MILRCARWVLLDAALVLSLLLVGGCGDQMQAESIPREGKCVVDAPSVANARILARVDLDGDGHADNVKLAPATAECPDLLVAEVGSAYLSARLPAGGPPPATAFGVSVPGGAGALLLTRQEHPRGGFQLRLYAVGTTVLSELRVEGRPVVPFVALDVQEHPLSVDCMDGGVTVTEAVAHRPRGAVFAWDIRRTPYAVDGTVVTRGPTREIADNVRARRLEVTYPDLLAHTVFRSCRTSA